MGTRVIWLGMFLLLSGTGFADASMCPMPGNSNAASTDCYSFMIDPTQTGLPKGTKYCVMGSDSLQNVIVLSSDGHSLTWQASPTGKSSCVPITDNKATNLEFNIVNPSNGITTGNVTQINSGVVCIFVYSDGTEPTSCSSTVSLPGSKAAPLAYVEMTFPGQGKHGTVDLSQVDWQGVPANITITSDSSCTEQGLCNEIGSIKSVGLEDIQAKAEAYVANLGKNYALSNLLFPLNSWNKKYRALYNPHDYLEVPDITTTNYTWANNSDPLNFAYDSTIENLFSSSSTPTTSPLYIQGVAFGKIKPAVYRCVYQSELTPYPNNSGNVVPKIKVGALQCSSLQSGGGGPFYIYDPRDLFITETKTEIASSNSAITGSFKSTGCPTLKPSGIWNYTFDNGTLAKDVTGWWMVTPGLGNQAQVKSMLGSPGNYTGVIISEPGCPPPKNSVQAIFYAVSPLKVAAFSSYGDMVFGAGGIFADNTLQYPTNPDSATVLGNLEFQINAALNRGVVPLPTDCADRYPQAKTGGKKPTATQCWGDYTFWYTDGTAFNPYSAFLQQQNLFKMPESNGSLLSMLGMAYSFSYSETPTQPVTNITNPPFYPQVPPKWDSAYPLPNTGSTMAATITLTPWVSQGDNTFSIKGWIYGAKQSVSVSLSPQSPSGANTYISQNAFAFDGLAQGSYTLTIVKHPSNQTCIFKNTNTSSVDVTLANIDSVTNNITCSSDKSGYTVGGVVRGLDSGKAITLRNNRGLSNGGDTMTVTGTISSPVPFSFPMRVASNHGYQVTIKEQPPGQICNVTQHQNGTSSRHSNSQNVVVSCNDNPSDYSVGGEVLGLSSGDILNVSLNNAPSVQVPGAGSGSLQIPFTLSPDLAAGLAYQVNIPDGGQPKGKVCQVQNGGGTIQNSDVTNVQISCADDPTQYKIYGNVTGLLPSQSVNIVDSSGTGPISTSVAYPQSAYAFKGLSNGASYSLSLDTATCTFVDGDKNSGVISGADVQVNVVCTSPGNASLSVQNQGLSSQLLTRSQAAVVQVNGGLVTPVWGGSTSPTPVASLPNGSSYSAQIIGQSSLEWCGGGNPLGSGILNAPTVLPMTCTNVNSRWFQPGVCNSEFNNQLPSGGLFTRSSLCGMDGGYSSGVGSMLPDGRYKWFCSGSGNPMLNTSTWATGGTQACYSLSNSDSRRNQQPLVITATNWTITAGASQTFSVTGGSSTGDLSSPKTQAIGDVTCTVQLRERNPPYQILAKPKTGRNGSGACVVWVTKAGDSKYFSVDAPPAVFNVKPQ